MEEWEQVVHTTDDPTQKCGYRWKDPTSWSWRAHELSGKEMFACLTRPDSGDESDSLCEPYCAPNSLDFDNVPHGAHKPMDDGRHTSCDSPPAPPGLLSTPQSSWQPYSNTNTTQDSWVFRRHVFRPPDEATVIKPVAPEVVHPVQYGITPKQLLLPQSDRNSLLH